MSTAPKKRENLLVNLVFNIAIPSLILSKLSKEHLLGPVWGLVVALAFPLGYALWDFARRREVNFISAIGFVSVLASGGLGLLKAELIWFAVKEAAVPSVIGLAVLVSMGTKKPLVNTMLYNDQVLDKTRIDAALAERGTRAELERLLKWASYGLAASFLISAVLNFVLARYFLVSAPGTPEFNAELGKMNAWSWPIIAIPTTAMTMLMLWKLMSGIRRLTGLKLEEIMHSHAASTEPASASESAQTSEPGETRKD